MATMKSTLALDWSSLSGLTAGGSGTPSVASNKLQEAGVTGPRVTGALTGTGAYLVTNGAYSVAAGIDRAYVDLLACQADPANATTGYEVEIGVVTNITTGSGILGRYSHDGSHAGSDGPIKSMYIDSGSTGGRSWAGQFFNATSARYLAVAVDFGASTLRVQYAASGADLSVDANWTDIDSYAFGAVAPTFDPSSYYFWIDIAGMSTTSTTGHAGMVNTTSAGGGGGGGINAWMLQELLDF